jgi:hypothetical protein
MLVVKLCPLGAPGGAHRSASIERNWHRSGVCGTRTPPSSPPRGPASLAHRAGTDRSLRAPGRRPVREAAEVVGARLAAVGSRCASIGGSTTRTGTTPSTSSSRGTAGRAGRPRRPPRPSPRARRRASSAPPTTTGAADGPTDLSDPNFRVRVTSGSDFPGNARNFCLDWLPVRVTYAQLRSVAPSQSAYGRGSQCGRAFPPGVGLVVTRGCRTSGQAETAASSAYPLAGVECAQWEPTESWACGEPWAGGCARLHRPRAARALPGATPRARARGLC